MAKPNRDTMRRLKTAEQFLSPGTKDLFTIHCRREKPCREWANSI